MEMVCPNETILPVSERNDVQTAQVNADRQFLQVGTSPTDSQMHNSL